MRRAGVAAVGIATTAAGADGFFGAGLAKATQAPKKVADPATLLKPGAPKKGVLEGVIVSVGSRSLAIRSPNAKAAERVVLAPDADVSKEGQVPLSAYRLGDEVVAFGDARKGFFAAVGLAAVFRTRESVLLSRTENVLRTSQGDVVLSPSTEAQSATRGGGRSERRSVTDLRPGDRLLITGLENQRSSVLAASRISVIRPGLPAISP